MITGDDIFKDMMLEGFNAESLEQLGKGIIPERDSVNHPEHYNANGGVECIDAIHAALGPGFTYFLQGNVIKYVWRFRDKGFTEDLRKARWYIDRMIEVLDA